MNKRKKITTNIIWHDATQELPKTSGKYLCIMSRTNITLLSFSTVHMSFNITDKSSYEDTIYIIKPLYWAECNFVNEFDKLSMNDRRAEKTNE